MSRVRSPLALVASIGCLLSAATLASLLLHDGVGATLPNPVGPGDEVRLHGELVALDAPEWAEHIDYALTGTTYVMRLEDPRDVIVLTGLEPGWNHRIVVARAALLLDTPHPSQDVRILVFSARDVQEPVVFR